MIVKNKKKFVRGILLIIGLAIGLILLMTGNTFSHQDIKYKTVSVVSGDTLWDIAGKEKKNNIYYKDADIRDIIEDIKEVNKLSSADLSIAQILEIPTY